MLYHLASNKKQRSVIMVRQKSYSGKRDINPNFMIQNSVSSLQLEVLESDGPTTVVRGQVPHRGRLFRSNLLHSLSMLSHYSA